MRDIKRIRKFCNELADIWESECPDWRFFQLVTNVLRGDGRVPFYIEDDEAMKSIEEYFSIYENTP